MSKTHTGDVTNAARKVARWLGDKAKGAGHPPSKAELSARVDATCGKFNEEDRASIMSAALVFFKRNDPEGHVRLMHAWN